MSDLSKAKLLEIYKYLLKARRNEEKYLELTASGVMPSWIHSELGQEGVGVGVATAMQSDDYITYHHRARSILEPRGVDLCRFMAEFLCKEDGLVGGRLGEFFVQDFDNGVVMSTCLVGDSLPFATGLALANQYNENNRVTICLFGDGSVDSGLFHESLNLAALWKLPIVFICCNNGFSQFVPQELTASVTEVYKKAAGYGIPGLFVDGTDVLAVHKTAKELIEKARAGDGPSLLECKVDRWEGHFYGDPQRYRERKDIEQARKNDPLLLLQDELVKKNILTESIISDFDDEASQDLLKAIDFAERSPKPSVDAVTKHVYCEG